MMIYIENGAVLAILGAFLLITAVDGFLLHGVVYNRNDSIGTGIVLIVICLLMWLGCWLIAALKIDYSLVYLLVGLSVMLIANIYARYRKSKQVQPENETIKKNAS